MNEKPGSTSNFTLPEPPYRPRDRWRSLRVYGWILIVIVGLVLARWIYDQAIVGETYHIRISAEPYQTRGESSEAERFLPLLQFELQSPDSEAPLLRVNRLGAGVHEEQLALRGRKLVDHAVFRRLHGVLRYADNQEIWVEPEMLFTVGDTLSFRLSIQQAQDMSLRVIRSHFGVNDLRGRPLSGLEPLFKGTLRESPGDPGKYIIEIEVGELFDLKLSEIDSLEVPVRNPAGDDDPLILPVALEWFSNPPPPRRVLEIALSSLVLRDARAEDPSSIWLRFNSILDPGTATAEINYQLWPKDEPGQPIGIQVARLDPQDGSRVQVVPLTPLRPAASYVVRAIQLVDHVGAPIDPNRSRSEFVCPRPEAPPAPAPPSRGDLRVFTNPPGASIWLNGVARSERSNRTLRGLDPGEYRVRVEREEYEPQEKIARLAAGETVSLAFDLERTVVSPGRLEMTARPFADFVVDGELVASGIGRAELELEPGLHRVEMRHPLFRSFVFEDVRVQSGQATRLTHDFTSVEAYGRLQVPRVGAWASIYVDGEDTGQTTPAILDRIRVGQRRVSLWRNGAPLAGFEKVVVVREGEITVVEFD